MRRLPVFIAIVVSALVFAGGSFAASLFVVTGRGWGHGIGMSQYGAYGLAQNGRTYDEILAHYYPGTTLDTRSPNVKVLLASARQSLTIGSVAQFRYGTSGTLAAGTWQVRAAADGRLRLTKGATTRLLASGTTFRQGSALLALNGDRYRGTIVVKASGGRLYAVNTLGINAYVQGVVPQEMPPSWDLEALKAQAVPARSYALAAGGHCSGPIVGANVLCRDTRDQVYDGREAETASTNTAVAQTAGQVLEFQGAVATTYFHSTSGGRTAAIADEWGSAPVPYLVSVADPTDSISPHHRWGPRDPELDCPGTTPDCVFTATAFARKLGLSSVRDATVGLRNGSNRVERVDVVGSGNPSFTGAEMRSRLGLRSTWFSIGVLSIRPDRLRMLWDQRVSLALLVRGVSGAHLQRRPAGQSWIDTGLVSGSATKTFRLRRSNTFRFNAPVATGPNVLVQVAPRVNFAQQQPRDGSALVGAVRPKSLAGREVRIQKRRANGSWRRVASAIVNADGVFRARFSVTPGVYRAVLTPPASSGLTTGVSPTLTVQAA